MTIFDSISLFISIVTLLMLYQLHRTVVDKVLNNIDLEMSKIAFQEMSSLSYKTSAEKALRAYIRKSVSDVYQKYLHAKTKGIKLINEQSFIEDLLGNAEIELNALYDKYPSIFLKSVDALASEHYGKFKDNLLFDIKSSKKNNYKDALKINTLSTVKAFVQSVVTEFDKTKHLIEDIEFKKHQDKQYFHLTEKSKYFDFETKVIIKKDEIKELLKYNNFNEAFDILNSISSTKIGKNAIILLQARYSDFNNNTFIGVEKKEVLNKIRADLLQYIDNL